ncbi:MAG: hypothetical protein JST92_16240, partial [Deltaproteobacteria bacterium]|nr:hypothetical protein [Deltaproteobacteria bacterium]
AVHAALRVNRSPRASFVVARLSRLELVAAVGPDEAQALLDAPEWRWLAAIPDTLPGDAVSATLETLASKPGPCAAGTSTHCLVDPTFDELLTGLATRGYVADSPSFASALTDRAAWLSSLTGKVADRSSAIELENARRKRSQPTGGLLLGLGASEMWSRRAISLRTSPRFEIDPSSVPNEPLPQATRSGIVLAHLLPYRVSLDVARGGLALSWFEPAVRITPWLALESQLDVLDFDAKNSAMSSTFGLLPTFTTGGLALSAGLRSSFLWDTAAFTRIGVVGRLALLQERLAFTAGVRSLAGPDKEFFVTLSIADLNGIAYWLTPWTREP